MSEHLSTYTVVALYLCLEEKKHFLTTKSIIKNKAFLSPLPATRDFENTLFYVEIEGNNLEFNVPIEYDQPIYLRHLTSQKYLTLTVDEEEEKEVRYRLVLGTEKKYFRINPCYQYQTKVSTKIKFDEEIYLSTEYTESRQGMIIAEEQQGERELFLGFSLGSKLQFHYYSTHEKEEKFYRHGKIVWLSHIESENFLSLAQVHGREEVVLEPIQMQRQIQNMSALWVIESKNLSQSRHLKYEEEVRFKNILSGHYLSFSRNYRLIDNERIYQIFLEETSSDHSRFLFRPILEKEQKEIGLSAYLLLLHCESNLFLGCRREKVTESCFKLLTFPYMEDQDLFKMHTFSSEEERALRFIVAIRGEFKDIESIKRAPLREVTLAQITEIQQTYLNIRRSFQIIQHLQKLFQFVRNQLGPSIRLIADILPFFRGLSELAEQPPSSTSSKSSRMRAASGRVISLVYSILCVFCEGHSANQMISFDYLSSYLSDVGLRVGAEEVIMETFRNNKVLLPRAKSPVGGEGNVVRELLLQFHHKNRTKNESYWGNLRKVLAVLNVLIFENEAPLDINQNIISEELFQNGFYEQIFVPLQVVGPRIVVVDPQKRAVAIEDVAQQALQDIIDQLLLLFSNLTCNHSFNSKTHIHRYLAVNNQACLSVMIAYLNKPIRQGLYDQLLNFVSKTYLDSSPRLKRIKPLPFIFFHFAPDRTHAEVEEGYISERLREMLMLKAEESRVCKPLHYSNLLSDPGGDSVQPSMSEEQLVTFRLNLTEQILRRSRPVSEPQLQTINLLMKLECYTMNQMLQLYEELKRKLLLGSVEESLQPRILDIVNQLYLLLLQLQTKKLTIYLKHKFTDNEKADLPPSEYQYVLPLSPRAPLPPRREGESHLLLDSSRSDASEGLLQDYNQLRDTLDLMHASRELQESLVNYFCSFKEERLRGEAAATYLQSLFNLILKTHLPKFNFLSLLSSSTVLTHEEVAEFDGLFATSKKLQYLIQISDFWFVGRSEPDIARSFLQHIQQLSEFLYEEGEGGRGSRQVSTKKQLFMNSLGVHQMVLQLLQKNAYLVAGVDTKKDLLRKHKEVFEACFEFIHSFIRHCSENKKSIEDFFPVLLLYENCIQLGQLRVFTEFFRDEKDFVKELNFSFIENVINRIVRARQHRELAEYNPSYLHLLIVMVHSLDNEKRPFVDRLFHLIGQPDIFPRLLFLEDSKGAAEATFCLKMHKIKLDPLQLPILYQEALLSLLELILLEATESIKNALKLKLTQALRVNYLFEILSQPDVFSNTGIQPQLNWALKEKVHRLIHIYIEKTDLAAQIYESEGLSELLQFWNRVLVKRPQRKEMTDESESFYLPFLPEVGDQHLTLEQSRDLYYFQHVRPFLAKLGSIFQKQKAHSHSHSAHQYLQSLQAALSDLYKETDFRKVSTARNLELKDVKLKWRNFVDDDEDNSKEEKYIKKVILDVLKSKWATDRLQVELHQFYEVIARNSKAFISSMVRLLRILFASKEIMEGRKAQSKTAEKVLKYLSEYIEFCGREDSGEQGAREVQLIARVLEEHRFIEIFTDLTSSKDFELRKRNLKTIFYYCLKVVNFLLQHDGELRVSKLLFRIFKENPHSYKFLEFLKEGALEIISTIDPHSHYEQINSSLAEMRLCVDSRPLHLYEQAYLTLTLLCRHEPFTSYLRSQQSSFAETDFLDKLYNILMFLFKQNSFSSAISISSVRAAEHILDFICSMLTGLNQANQNYLIDNKYPQFVLQALKLEDLSPSRYEFRAEREELLLKIVDFYRSNGIDIEELLRSKIRLIDFRHSYILNRFKFTLVKTLLECLITNENNLVRVKIDIPVQIIKLNLIWVYQLFKKSTQGYQEHLILKERSQWSSLIEAEGEGLDSLFLRLGFYYYQLIELYEERDAEGESLESDEKIINEEKEKERIVKKFFATIKEGRREKEKEGLLEGEEMREEMKYYFHTYYNALLFFREKTGSIEVDLKGEVAKVYFPKLPIAEKVTPEMREEFKIGVNRLTRDEKIKSLIEYENQFYEDLKGEEDYFNEIERRMPLLGPVLRMMKYEDEFLLVALVNSFLISLLYWLANYQSPSYEFTGEFVSFISLSNAANPFGNILMLALSLLNLLIGILIGVYLFTRKIPLRKKLLTLKFLDLQAKAKGKKDTPTNESLYVWSNIAKETAYNIFIVAFLILTILHPFFSCFILVQIIGRIQMGRFIIRSIKETWSQLLVAIGLLVVFNVFFVQVFYGFYTSATGYGTMCSSQYTCMLLLMDQNLKGGGGVLGNVDSDFTYMVLNTQVIAEIMYIVISIKVIAEIFSGTIIDKFSELRQEEEKIQDDQKKICYICGQERFDLDLEYEGFSVHTQNHHDTFNYIKYLFYLRRCPPREQGIVERYIQDQRRREVEKWIPEDNSCCKQKKQRLEEEKRGEKDVKEKVLLFVKDKLRDMKRVRQRVELMTADIRRESKKGLQ